ELLLEAVSVTGLCIGVAQFLQLGGRLVVGRSNFLIHERAKSRPYGVCALHGRGKMLLTPLCLALSLCRRGFGILLPPSFPSLDGFGGKIRAPHRLANRDLQPWIRQPV